MNSIHLVVAAHPTATAIVILAVVAILSLVAGGSRDVAAVIQALPPNLATVAPVEVRPPVKVRSVKERRELRQQIAHEQEEAEHHNLEAAHGLRHDR